MGSWLPWRKLASNPPGLDWPALPWQSRGLYALLLGRTTSLAKNDAKPTQAQGCWSGVRPRH